MKETEDKTVESPTPFTPLTTKGEDKDDKDKDQENEYTHEGEEAPHIRFLEEKTALNPPDLQTTHVLIEVVINSIEDIDSVTQSAYVDFNISYMWKDPEVEGKIWDQIDWDKLFKPHVVVLNSIDVEPTLQEKNYWVNMNLYPHNMVSHWQRYKGRIKIPLDLKKFPFDTQVLKIQLGSSIWTLRDTIFYDMTTKQSLRDMTKNLKFVEWDVVEDFKIKTDDDDLGPNYSISLTITRKVGYYFSKILSIVSMLMLMVLVVFFISADTLNDRAGLIFTLFLASVAFHFVISDLLPRVSYVTTLDMIMVVAYLLMFLATVQSVVASLILRNYGESASERFDLICGVVYFGLYLLTVLAVIINTYLARRKREEELEHETTKEADNQFYPYKSKDPVAERIEKTNESKKILDEYEKNRIRGTKDKDKVKPEGADEEEEEEDMDNEESEEIKTTKAEAKALILNDAKIKPNEIYQIAAALQNTTWVTILDLSFNFIGDDGAITLANSLKDNTTLKTLYLSQTGIGSKGAIALCGEQVALGLTKLDLYYNQITDSAAPAFAQLLVANRPLVHLCLGSNKLTSDGVKIIASGLTSNTKLHFLQLNYNMIGNNAARALKSALELNSTLVTLHVGESKISKVWISRLEAVLSSDERKAKQLELDMDESDVE